MSEGRGRGRRGESPHLRHGVDFLDVHLFILLLEIVKILTNHSDIARQCCKRVGGVIHYT